MKITITPETDEEKRDMKEDATTFEGVGRYAIIMGENQTWFTMRGPLELLRTDVARMDHQLASISMVACVKQAMQQLAVHAQIANSPAAKIGNRIIQTGH